MQNLRKYIAIAGLVVSVFLLIGCGQGQSAADKANDELIKEREAQDQALKQQSSATTALPWKNITAAQAENLIHSDPNVQIIDVREAYAFANKRITNAKLMPLAQIETTYDKTINESKPVLLYDNDGTLVPKAAQFLISRGFTNIYTLSGGMQEWHYEVEPKSAQ